MAAREVTACGDEIVRSDDGLVVYAAFPIDGLEVSRFRKPILLWGGGRWELLAVEGTPKQPIYRFLPELPNIYAPPGDEFPYDPERHLDRARSRRAYAVAFVIACACIPLMPFLGVLPAAWKQRLVAVGVDPGRSTRASLMLEWLLLTPLLIAYPFMGGFFTLGGAFVGALLLLLGLDIAYRASADQQDEHVGMFAVVGELWKLGRVIVQEIRRKEPPPDQ